MTEHTTQSVCASVRPSIRHPSETSLIGEIRKSMANSLNDPLLPLSDPLRPLSDPLLPPKR